MLTGGLLRRRRGGSYTPCEQKWMDQFLYENPYPHKIMDQLGKISNAHIGLASIIRRSLSVL